MSEQDTRVRDAMLVTLTDAMRRLHRRRRRLRHAAAALVAVAAAGLAWTMASPRQGDTRLTHVTQSDRPAPAPETRSRVLVVRQEARTGRIRLIDDQDLVTRLNEIGRPAGVIRSGDRVWLTDVVTDPQGL